MANKTSIFPSKAPLYLNLFLQGHTFPFLIELKEIENKLTLSRIDKNLLVLENNGKRIVYFANQGGVFQIPNGFSGTLVFNLTYEKIFPDFAGLSNLTGLCITGYLQNIKDCTALKTVYQLKNFLLETNDANFIEYLSGRLHFLNGSSKLVDRLKTSSLKDIRVLMMEDGDDKIFKKIFQMPSLQIVALSTTFTLKESDPIVPLCMQLSQMIDSDFPIAMVKVGLESFNSYNAYTSSINESGIKYGNENKGIEQIFISETIGDYPMEYRESVEIRPYGLTNGSLFFSKTSENIVTIKLNTSRDKALLILNRIKGLSLSIQQDKIVRHLESDNPVVTINKPEQKYEDQNHNEFKEKTKMFEHR